MLRHLYHCALRLHPPGFRRRFGEEMLSIFDHAEGRLAAFRLLFDAAGSLSRQWLFRPAFWNEIAPLRSIQPAADGVPSFSTIEGFRPRPSAVIDGVVLSITLFCLTCFAIRYSWIHVLHVHIPEVQFDSYVAIHPGASPSELRGKASPSKERPPVLAPEQSGPISERLQVDVMPVEPAPTVSAATETKRTRSHGLSPAIVRAPAVPIAVKISLEPFVGTYISLSPRLTISVEIQDGALSMKITGQPKHTLSPVSQTMFVAEGEDDISVEFVPDTKGEIRQLLLGQHRQRIIAQRQ